MKHLDINIEVDDQNLLRQVQEGNQSACEDFVRRYQDVVISIVARKVPPQDSTEVVQTVMINALQSIGSYDGRKPIRNWLSRVAVCKCYDYWRGCKRASRYTGQEACVEWARNEFQEAMRLESEAVERAKELTELSLAQLTAEDRMVVSLAYLDGLPIKEVADLLGWSQVGVRVRLHRGKKRMRTFLTNMLAGGQGDEQSK